MKSSYTVQGNIVDVVNRRIFSGIINIEKGHIKKITPAIVQEKHFILPGLIDSHVHIESSMLIPSEFARIAITHGTTACVSDPHELANVMGIEGVMFMINNGKKTPFKFYFGAPSCVPATGFETSGSVINSNDIEKLLQMHEIKYLAEMMNFPGVLFEDNEVMKKLYAATQYNKVVDGHAPGLRGSDAKKYIDAGITTDHECFSIEEAEEKISYGMKVLIREGSAAKNFDELIPLIKKHPDSIMLCSDDKHPDDLIKGHINLLIKRAVEKGYDIIDILRTVTLNPTQHYKLDSGLLQKGDSADFIIIDNLNDFNVLETHINGQVVFQNGKSLIESVKENPVNAFNCIPLKIEDIVVFAEHSKINVIKALEGQLITQRLITNATISDKKVISNTEKDILKIVVLQRYKPSKPSVAFINGFGLKQGAMASTIAHDSHNIIAVGTNDTDIIEAINLLIKNKGGISVVNNKEKLVLPLPFGGLMTDETAHEVANKYHLLDDKVKKMGSTLKAPFMTLAFMALLVIPELKISDKGLFDGSKFEFTSLFSIN
ncbi:MAG: adenine deaminase [Bacteroidales bacterium]|nr:adenine deaminase [Bacteroidales bacterium]